MDLKVLLVSDINLLGTFIRNAEFQALISKLNWNALKVYYQKKTINQNITYLEANILQQLEQGKIDNQKVQPLFRHFYSSCRSLTDSAATLRIKYSINLFNPFSTEYAKHNNDNPSGLEIISMSYQKRSQHTPSDSIYRVSAFQRLFRFNGTKNQGAIDLVTEISASLGCTDFCDALIDNDFFQLYSNKRAR